MKKEINKIKIAVIFLVPFLIITFQKSAAQPNYRFNFDKDWDWVEFIYGGHDITEEAKAVIDNMSKSVDIVDARKLFKYLSLLEFVNKVKEMSDVALIDSLICSNNNRAIIDASLVNFFEESTLSGIIFTAAKLFSLRTEPPFSAKTFIKREQLSKLTDTIDADFKLQFNYSNAETILDLLDYEVEDYYSLLEEKTTGYTEKLSADREKVNECFKYAVNKSPVYNIYKFIFPNSFGNLGGVFVYRDLFRSSIKQIKGNEQQITFEVKNRLYQFLPLTMNLNTEVKFSFALGIKDDFLESGTLIYNLETSGNDSRLIFTNLSRRLFEKGKSRIYINILPYIFDKSDTLYAKIIGGVHEGGLLNYIAPTSIETRPLSLLEKDFMHFRRTCNEIKKGIDTRLIDTLITLGFQGLGLFSTMGTQMAYDIEKGQGKSAIKNSLTYGPFYFFKTYINEYYEDPKSIRHIFRFTPELEDKINVMMKKLPEEIISSVSSLAMQKGGSDYYTDAVWNEYIITKSKELQEKHSKKYNGYTVYLLTGELFFKNKLYSEAAASYLQAYMDVPDKQRYFNIISNKFFIAGAYTECIEFTNGFINYNRTLPESYLMLGKIYFNLNNFEKAKENLEMVILLDPLNVEADMLLNELKYK
ncbi:MAG: tetratricopeptide repeat protein [Ignavibacteria bacterium]|nr:tetratricopeptide repeat protein [Ignavibacteria bacterium]